MKEMYTYWLRSQCEYWLNENYSAIFRTSYLRISQSLAEDNTRATAQDASPLFSQVNLAVGPWKSLYFHFQEPGQAIQTHEKTILQQLRDAGHRVMIIRHLEDFKTDLRTYLPAHTCQEPIPIYTRKSA